MLLVVHWFQHDDHARAVAHRGELNHHGVLVRGPEEVDHVRDREALVRPNLDEPAARLVNGRQAHPLHRGDVLGRVRDHIVVESAAYLRLQLVHLDATALGSPPGLEALLCGPKVPELLDPRAVGALDDDLGSISVDGCRSLRITHVRYSLFVVLRRLRCSSKAAPKRSSRASHSARYLLSQLSRLRNGSGRSE